MKTNLLSVYCKRKSIEIGLFWLVISFILNAPISRAEIEVYSAGRYFKSFEDYQKNQDQVDIGKFEIKKITISDTLISKEEQKALDKMGYDGGVNHAVDNFKKNRKDSQLDLIKAQDVEETIREALSNKTDPALLMVDSGKMRIVSFAEDQTDKQ